MAEYVKPTWDDGDPPAISAANLQALVDAAFEASYDKWTRNGGQPPAPKPQAYIAADDIGVIKRIASTENADLTLPAGGSWAYWGWLRSTTVNTTPSNISYVTASMAAGGTVIVAAGGAGTYGEAMVWRVA